MIGIPKGFRKAGVRKTTAEITDVEGFGLLKGQRFFVLEMKIERPEGWAVNIAIDNGFEDDSMLPVTAIDEDDFNSFTEESK